MLGVSVRNLTDEDRRRLEVMDALKGVLISKVNGRTANSPAGPQVNDIICQINKDLVTDVRSFRELLSELPAGQAAAVWIWRQGKLIQGSFIAGAQEGSG
ncbi:MAG: PDZ domain-containing protein [Verrucomicrobiales bacterium]